MGKTRYPDLSMPIPTSFYPDLSVPISEENVTTPNSAAQELQKKAEEQGYKPAPNTVPTFLGNLPDVTQPEINKQFFKAPSKEDIQKGAASILPFVAPEIKSIPYLSNAISKIPGLSPIANMAGRIGYGTALNSLSNAMMGQNPNVLTNLALNTALEAPSLLYRIPRGISQIFNPKDYTINKINQIRNETKATENVMNKMYEPINTKYNEFKVALNPKEYLSSVGIKRPLLYENARQKYDEFLKTGNYRDLQNLQSQIGKDWARISQSPATEGKAQLFNQFRNTLKDKVKNFLSRDQEALNQYNLADKYASNVHYPYLATPTLRKVFKGKQDIEPNKLAKSIQLGTEKTVGKEYKNVIPEGHALRNHLNDLNSRIHLGQLAQIGMPLAAGTIIGNIFHPGLLGAGGGLASGLLGATVSKLGGAPIAKLAQNPLLENIFRKTEPYYYKGGRALIGNLNE